MIVKVVAKKRKMFNCSEENLMKIENMSLDRVRTVAEAVEKFSWSLYGAMKDTEKGNFVFSPYGAHVVLAMLSEGAREATLQMMKKEMFLSDSQILRKGYEDLIQAMKTGFLVKLCYEQDSLFRDREIMVDDSYTLETANAGFFMRGCKLLGSFEGDLKKNFHTEIMEVDFQDKTSAARIINNWVQISTKDYVKDFITADSLDDQSGLVSSSNPGIILLASALYFKCDWNFKLSHLASFWVTEEESKQVLMLRLHSEMKYARLEEVSGAMVELPYQDQRFRFVMQVVLPDDRMGVFELENELVEIDIQDLFRRKQQPVIMDLVMPKLNLTNKLNLSDSLKKMGMADLFSADTSDFSGITGSRLLYLTEVQQKVLVEVTGGEGNHKENKHFWSGFFHGKKNSDSETKNEPKYTGGDMFNVDHPFIFMIRDTLTDMILFQGRVVDPSV